MKGRTVERRYQLTRVRSGEYLLPSNDGTKLFRIRRYQEDGTLEGDNGRRVYGWFWDVEIWPGDYRAEWSMVLRTLDQDDLYGDHWRSYWVGLRTRAEAIRAALGDDT